MPCYFYYFANYETEEIDFSELYCEFSDDDSKDIKAVIARGLHEALTLTEKSDKNVYMFGECF
jgi:hypothetical protein